MRFSIPVIKDVEMNKVAPRKFMDGANGVFVELNADSYTREGEFLLGEDKKTVVLFMNDGEIDSSVCIKAGNGFAGHADLEVSLLAGMCATVTPESARFKNVYGPDKGKVIISAPEVGAVKIAVFEAP